jgi:anthranilate synthase/aminodeoxychorismate synthase-like glutamine amidotransferase
LTRAAEGRSRGGFGAGRPPRLLLLDNHDSFTWNLVHGFERLGAEVRVATSDRVGLGWIERRRFDAIVISPGPGRPDDAGISVAMARAAVGRIALLGVCLGHQAIARAHGARVVRAPAPVHGKTSPVRHGGGGLYRGLPCPFPAMRYHSLAVDPGSLPGDLVADAWTPDGVIMGLRHRRHPVFGVQFHPESVATDAGQSLLRNFLRIVRSRRRTAPGAAPSAAGAR